MSRLAIATRSSTILCRMQCHYHRRLCMQMVHGRVTLVSVVSEYTHRVLYEGRAHYAAAAATPTGGVVTSPLGSIKPIPLKSVTDYVFKDADNWADEPLATCAMSGRSYSYGMTRMLIERFARVLVGHCGMQPREVIGLYLPNIPEYIIAAHGALKAGLVVTFANPLYTPDEIKRQFANAGVRMIMTIPLFLEVATTIGTQLNDYKSTICVGGDDDLSQKVLGFQSLLMQQDIQAELSGVGPKELAILPYSSGTTGLPKGVMLTHYNLVANLVQSEHPEVVESWARDGKKHRVFTVLPYFHIYGFNAIMNLSIKDGCHLISIPRFTPEDYLTAVIKYRPTLLMVVPSLLLFLASHPAVTKEHLSSVEEVQSGAAPLLEGLIDKFRRKVGRDDILIRQGYGMTESSPVTLIVPRNVPASKLNTAGVPYPGTECKIVDLESMDDNSFDAATAPSLGPHRPGELLCRGPQIMMGYLNNEKATAETVDSEGWLHTGDVAYYDEDRYFYIIDRCKELIKVKGNQVSPTELEEIILQMDDVVDVGVVGVPDELAGQVPKAFVVRKADSKLTEQDVKDFLHSKVSNYKRLNGGVKFVDSIPRNSAGKIVRSTLKIMK